MSALGHKQTCAVHQPMSALHPIATAKADIRKRSCLLYPQKRTCAVHQPMSALGQKRTHAVQQTAPSFEHFVSEREQRRWRSQRGRDGAYFQISSALSTYTLDTLTASAIPRKLWRNLLARSSPAPSCATGP